MPITVITSRGPVCVPFVTVRGHRYPLGPLSALTEIYYRVRYGASAAANKEIDWSKTDKMAPTYYESAAVYFDHRIAPPDDTEIEPDDLEKLQDARAAFLAQRSVRAWDDKRRAILDDPLAHIKACRQWVERGKAWVNPEIAGVGEPSAPLKTGSFAFDDRRGEERPRGRTGEAHPDGSARQGTTEVRRRPRRTVRFADECGASRSALSPPPVPFSNRPDTGSCV